jgi:glycosyltransferase involved in cell wall biosynthesis
MNILLINHYAGSLKYGMEYRPFYLCREWARLGHNVHIIAGTYSHVRTINPIDKDDFDTEICDGINYHWIKTSKYKGNGIKRAISMYEFVYKIFNHARRLSEEIKPDIVISSSTYPLDTYAAQRIALKSGAKVIHEVHDMWPLTLIEIAGMSRYNPFIISLQHAENYAYKKSDAVVSLLPNAKEYMKDHGLQDKKFYYIPNGIVSSDWGNKIPLPEKQFGELLKLKNDKKIICVYFGSHTNTYGLKYYIHSAKLLEAENIALVLIGDGMEKEKFKKQAIDEGLKNVVFLDPIPKQAVPAMLEIVDIVYVGGTKSKMRKFGAAMNKVYDSMMAGKPIVYAVDIPNNDVKLYNCGVTVDLESAEAIAGGIKKLMDLSPEERGRLGANGHCAVIQHYDYCMISKQFLNLMQKLKQD